jgi:hypothetical protein
MDKKYPFLSDKEKLDSLIKANETLRLDKSTNQKVVFVYSAPKVGSTSIVTSLRIFADDILDVIHIHDEDMLQVLGSVKGITVNEIIHYNKYLGKDVFVIDVYRSPIERKISAFFEKVGVYHFNNTDENVNTYNIQKVIKRFNKIFPYIGVGDHFMDKYQIPVPAKFDYNKKCLLLECGGIKYVKLRLKDSKIWNVILSQIFKINMVIVKDYESSNKQIGELYGKFKSNYKIPKNLLEQILQCKYLNYYYSEEEINDYRNEWTNKSCDPFEPYTLDQYKMYEELTIENSHIDYIQYDHYMDEGCKCKACKLKRNDIALKLLRGLPVTEKIVHIEAKSELIAKRIAQAKNYNKIVSDISHNKSRDFKNIVTRRNY